MYNAVPAKVNRPKVNKILEAQNPIQRKIIVTSDDYAFGEYVFPLIDTSPLAVVYGKENSAPCWPPNVILAIRLYAYAFNIPLDEAIRRCCVDPRGIIAVHMYDYYDGNRMPSEDTMERFEFRLLRYEWHYNVDLLREVLLKISEGLSKEMGVSHLKFRIDSVLIDSNIERMSRYKLIFKCVQRFVVELNRTGMAPLDCMSHYLRHNDWNMVSYHDEKTPLNQKIGQVLADADYLIRFYEDDSLYNTDEKFLILKEVFEDQVIESYGYIRLRKDKTEGLNSTTIQSPVDPEATARIKHDELHIGDVGVVTEIGSGSDTLIDYYSCHPNITSDEVATEEFIDYQEKALRGQTIQGPAADPANQKMIRELSEAWKPSHKPAISEETAAEAAASWTGPTLPALILPPFRLGVGDGGFSSEYVSEKAKEVGIRFKTTNKLGGKPDEFLSNFTMDQDGHTIVTCPYGSKPKKQKWNAGTNQIYVIFDGKDCEHCPFKDHCKPKFQKRGTTVKTVSSLGIKRAKELKETTPKELSQLSNYRNGVETIFSLMRRFMHLDRMPQRGLQATRFQFGCMVGGYNARKASHHFSKKIRSILKNFEEMNIWEDCALLEEVLRLIACEEPDLSKLVIKLECCLCEFALILSDIESNIVKIIKKFTIVSLAMNI